MQHFPFCRNTFYSHVQQIFVESYPIYFSYKLYIYKVVLTWNGVTKYGKNWHEEGIIEAINKIYKKKQIREEKYKLLIYRCEAHYNRLSYNFRFQDIKF